MEAVLWFSLAGPKDCAPRPPVHHAISYYFAYIGILKNNQKL